MLVLSLVAVMPKPRGRCLPPAPRAEDASWQSPATATAWQGPHRLGRGKGSARPPAPGANPRVKYCRGAHGNMGFQPHISFSHLAKGLCRFLIHI